jgi:general nucleoside transport system ATP-binding protein
MSEPLLSLRRVIKRFPGVLANDRVNFDAFGGEVHALLGENGAGKSTLMKIAYGYYPMDEGEIWVAGKQVRIKSPADARRFGIGMVFQSFTLIPAFTVAENVSLYLPSLAAIPDTGAIEKDIQERASRFGLAIDPKAVVGTLAAGQQQKVEILKLLVAGARVLIFDEPTSVLPPHEIESLFEVFERLKAAGYAVVFITHKLHEVLECADRITVMRRGTVAGTIMGTEATEDRLLQMMFGASPAEESAARPAMTATDQPPVLRLEKVSSGGAGLPLKDLDLELMSGEIVGVAGVSGNGQRELGDVVLGLLPIVSGRKWVFGADATHWSVSKHREAGIAFVPENPIYMAVAPGMTLAENFAITSPRTYPRAGGVGVDWSRVRADMQAAYRALDLEAPDPNVRASTLSGGNLQRFSLARELGRKPRIVVALYPTRGLDARTAIHAQNLLVSARASGAGVLLMSQDLGELFSLSDRIVVMRSGRVVGGATPQQTTQLEIGRLMTGGA